MPLTLTWNCTLSSHARADELQKAASRLHMAVAATGVAEDFTPPQAGEGFGTGTSAGAPSVGGGSGIDCVATPAAAGAETAGASPAVAHAKKPKACCAIS